MRKLLWIVFALVSTSCATSFTGSAKVPGGVKGCRARCAAWDLEFAGMVQMGEYSDGCICQEKGTTVSKEGIIEGMGAAVGVVLAMRARQQQQQAVYMHQQH